MADLTTLVTPSQIVDLTNIDINFDLCSLRNVYNIELAVFRKNLCSEFREDLVNDLVDFSSVAEYSDTKAYSADDKVKFRGEYYTALKATTGNRPTVTQFWTPSDHFKKDDYNELYNRHLAEYLALSVLKYQLPFIMTKVKNEGVLKFDGQVFKAVERTDEERLFDGVDTRRSLVFQNMDAYLIDNKTNDNFANYLGIKGSCSDCDDETIRSKFQTRKNTYRFG